MYNVVSVAFCANLRMEVPLHVAALSVLKNLRSERCLKIYVLTSDFPDSSIRDLRKTLNAVNRPYELVILKPDVSVFQGLKPFHGSLAAYYRILLPELVAEPRFVYLDIDTITTTDISGLFDLDMKGKAVGFLVDGNIGTALENKFFRSLGFADTDPAFNSGVMLVDIEQWKSQNCLDRILTFCRAHPHDLLAADQTALIALFSQDCVSFDAKYNIKLSTIFPEENTNVGGVYHFVGSPKPWDLFGRFFHPYYPLWKRYLSEVRTSVLKTNCYLNIQSWLRFPRIAGGYKRILEKRIEMKQSLVQKMDV